MVWEDTSFLHREWVCNAVRRITASIHETRGLIVLLYVDDMVLAAPSRKSIDWAKAALHEHFDMTDLGELTTFIRVEISRNRSQRILKASQEAYIGRILKDHGMDWCSTVATPVDPAVRLTKTEKEFVSTPVNEANRQRYQSAVGSLMYAILATRPDIAYAVGIVSQHCTNPNGHHWTAVKPTSGYIFVLNEGAISWASRKQPRWPCPRRRPNTSPSRKRQKPLLGYLRRGVTFWEGADKCFLPNQQCRGGLDISTGVVRPRSHPPPQRRDQRLGETPQASLQVRPILLSHFVPTLPLLTGRTEA